jgi:aminopeptidase N
VTAQCLDFQQAQFGRRYPFGDTYDQLFVPEFNAGAMENPGAVTFSESFVFRSRTTDDKRRQRAMVVAHEMSHMWFGDLVTMRWWDDLWLNESFAELMGFLTVDRATRFEGAWLDFSASRKAWGYRADQLPSTHPVQGDVPDNRSALLNFDGISYAKGASVLRQLMATVGEDVFFTAVRAYFERHAFGNTTVRRPARRAGDGERAGPGEWSRAWLQTSGVSTLRTWLDGRRRRPGLHEEADVLRPHRVAVGLYDLRPTTCPGSRRDRLDVQLDGESVELDVAQRRPDLVLPNDGDATFAKLRFDDQSLAVALTIPHRLTDPLARTLCWAALWDACRDGELPAADLVRAVLAGVDGESDPSVVATLLAQARTAATLYTADSAPLLDALAEASHRAALAAPPGSDLQLTRVRAFAAAARAGSAGALLAMLDGHRRAAGPGRRHRAALAPAGLPGGPRRGRGRRRGRRAGARRHLRGTAARADRALVRADGGGQAARLGPARRGRRAVQPRDAGLAVGFWRHGQDDVLAPYVDRYVADLPVLWADRSPQVAGTLAERLFPATLVRQDVLDRTAVLEAEEHPRGSGATCRRAGRTWPGRCAPGAEPHGTPSASHTASAHWR